LTIGISVVSWPFAWPATVWACDALVRAALTASCRLATLVISVLSWLVFVSIMDCREPSFRFVAL
jgi:hypothetical protein